MNSVKYIYTFARYFALVVQTTSFFLSQFYPLARAPVSAKVCDVWFMVLLVCCVVQLVVLDTVLMIQIYALYTPHSKKSLWLLPIVFCQFPLPFVAWARHTGFNEVCSLSGTLHGGVIVGGVGVIIHLFLFYIIFRKRNMVIGQAEIVPFVVRGAAWCFVLVMSVVGACIPYSYLDRTANPYIIFIWPSTLFSIATCRIVMSMRRMNSSSQHSLASINSSFTDVVTMEFPPEVSMGSLGPHFMVDFLSPSLEVTNEPPRTESSASTKAGTLQFHDPSDPKEFSAVDPDSSLKTENEI